MPIYEARRDDNGELVEFECGCDDAPGFGVPVTIELDGTPVACKRVFSRIQPPRITTNLGRDSTDSWKAKRTDGRFTSLQLPSLEQVQLSEQDPTRPSIPRAPHYDANENASFMNRSQARDYAKQLAGTESAGGEYAYQD